MIQTFGRRLTFRKPDPKETSNNDNYHGRSETEVPLADPKYRLNSADGDIGEEEVKSWEL